MLRFLILFCFIFLEKNAISFEMELNGKQENIFFVKKRNNNFKISTPKKKTIVINKNGNKNKTTGVINRAVVAEKQGGKVVNVNQINRNKNMYVSADDIVVPKVDDDVKKTKSITVDNKTINKISKKTNKSTSKVIISAGDKDGKSDIKDLILNNKSQVYIKPIKRDIVDKLCDMAIKNDVVNFKKTLMSVDYDKGYVDATCGYGNTLLMISIINDNYLTCKLLLENDVDVNIANDAKVSVLHTIVKQNGSNNDSMFKQLIGVKSINLDLQDIEGYTPVMRALLFDKFDYLKMLIEAGANIYVKNNYGEDILDLAKKQLKVANDNKKNELEEIVRILQEAKNNV
jgi:ankyrin repeat protein